MNYIIFREEHKWMIKSGEVIYQFHSQRKPW
jgi:cell division protein FtsB